MKCTCFRPLAGIVLYVVHFDFDTLGFRPLAGIVP